MTTTGLSPPFSTGCWSWPSKRTWRASVLLWENREKFICSFHKYLLNASFMPGISMHYEKKKRSNKCYPCHRGHCLLLDGTGYSPRQAARSSGKSVGSAKGLGFHPWIIWFLSALTTDTFLFKTPLFLSAVIFSVFRLRGSFGTAVLLVSLTRTISSKGGRGHLNLFEGFNKGFNSCALDAFCTFFFFFREGPP